MAPALSRTHSLMLLVSFPSYFFTLNHCYMKTIIEAIRYEIKNWWWFLVMGTISLAAGVVILARPVEGYVSLSILFRCVMVGTGVSQILFAVNSRDILRGWGWTLASGILDLILGIFLLMYPVVTMVTLPYFVGFYLVFRALYLIGVSFDLRSFGIRRWGWLLAGGILLLVLGFLILYYPPAGAVGIVAVSGSAFVVSGIFSIVLAFQLKSFKNEIERFEERVTGRVTATT